MMPHVLLQCTMYFQCNVLTMHLHGAPLQWERGGWGAVGPEGDVMAVVVVVVKVVVVVVALVVVVVVEVVAVVKLLLLVVVVDSPFK